jgi:hypothetical protein
MSVFRGLNDLIETGWKLDRNRQNDERVKDEDST